MVRISPIIDIVCITDYDYDYSQPEDALSDADMNNEKDPLLDRPSRRNSLATPMTNSPRPNETSPANVTSASETVSPSKQSVASIASSSSSSTSERRRHLERQHVFEMPTSQPSVISVSPANIGSSNQHSSVNGHKQTPNQTSNATIPQPNIIDPKT